MDVRRPSAGADLFTNRSRTAWYPVVRFTLPDGEVVETRTTYAVAPAPARPGESETVVSIAFGIIALAVGGLHTVGLPLARAAQG